MNQRTYLFEDVDVSYVRNIPLGTSTINLSASYSYSYSYQKIRYGTVRGRLAAQLYEYEYQYQYVSATIVCPPINPPVVSEPCFSKQRTQHNK